MRSFLAVTLAPRGRSAVIFERASCRVRVAGRSVRRLTAVVPLAGGVCRYARVDPVSH